MKFYVRPFKSKWLVSLLIGVVACVLSPQAPAQTSGGIEFIAPQPVYTAESAWFEREASVANSEPQTRQLRLAYRAGNQGGRQTEYFRVFDVPSGARRLVKLPIYPVNLSSLGRTVMPSPDVKLPVVAEDYSLFDARTDQRLALANQIPGNFTGILEVAVVGSDSSTGEARFKTLLTNVFGPNVLDVSSLPRKLHDRWYGYSAAGLIIMVQTPVEALRPSQVQAVLDYVRRGGVLLVTGNPSLGEMFSGPVGEAAGVSVAGVHEVVSLNLPGSKEVTRFNKPAPMAELAPDDAQVVFSCGELPLLTKRPFGKGWVFVLAVPLVNANETVLREVQQARNSQRLLDENAFLAPGKAAVSAIAGRAGPRRTVPTGMLLGIGALVLLGGLLAKFRGRGERVWLLLVPVALLLAIGMQIYGLTTKTPQRLSHIGLVSGLDDGVARVQQVLAFGTPDKQTVTFRTAGPSGVLIDVGESGGLGGVQSVRVGGTMSLPDMDVEPDATKALYLDEIMAVGRVESKLTFGPKGLEGTIQNGLGEDITDAIIYVGERSFGASFIPAGEQGRDIAIGRDRQLAPGEFTNGLLPDDQKNKLLRQLRVQAGPGRSPGQSALLIGTIKSSIVDPLDKQGVATQGWSVVTWPLKIESPKPGTTVAVPPGFVETQIRMGQTWSYMGRPFEGSGRVDIPLRAVLPPAVSSLEQAQMRLTMHVRASNYTMTLMRMGADGKGSEALAPPIENPTGVVSMGAMQLDKYRDSDGAYPFVIRLQPIRQGEEAPQWTLESADFALEGISR